MTRHTDQEKGSAMRSFTLQLCFALTRLALTAEDCKDLYEWVKNPIEFSMEIGNQVEALSSRCTEERVKQIRENCRLIISECADFGLRAFAGQKWTEKRCSWCIVLEELVAFG